MALAKLARLPIATREAPMPAPTLAVPAAPVARPRRRIAWSEIRVVLLGIVSLAGFVLLWYLATKFKLNFYIRFTNIPSPEAVLEHALKLAHTGRFYDNMLISLRRILIGFGLATVLGVALGLAIGRYRLARELMFPVFEVLRPIPAIAWGHRSPPRRSHRRVRREKPKPPGRPRQLQRRRRLLLRPHENGPNLRRRRRGQVRGQVVYREADGEGDGGGLWGLIWI